MADYGSFSAKDILHITKFKIQIGTNFIFEIPIDRKI